LRVRKCFLIHLVGLFIQSSSSGTIGSRHFGVAKQVSLVAVKVLGEDGRGSISDMFVLHELHLCPITDSDIAFLA